MRARMLKPAKFSLFLIDKQNNYDENVECRFVCAYEKHESQRENPNVLFLFKAAKEKT